MGQGFVLANLTKREYVSPHDIGLGYKIGEFGHPTNPKYEFRGSLVQFARELTAADGRWHGDQVFYFGDYGDVFDLDFAPVTEVPNQDGEHYGEICDNYAMLKDEARQFALKHADPYQIERLRGSWGMLDAVRSHDFGDGTDI